MHRITIHQVIPFLKKELPLFIALLLLVILTILHPRTIGDYPSFVHWKTVSALTGLLIIATGLKESGYFSIFSKTILVKLTSERTLALFLILFSAFLSAFLTNDITLFIVIPLTFSIRDIVKTDLSKLIIFEAIAVNVGSALTPIGNPQNLFLWHKWNISFLAFVVKMVPLVIFMLILLLLFIRIAFSGRKLPISKTTSAEGSAQKGLFITSVILLTGYVIALELDLYYIMLLFVFVFYIIFYKKVFLHVDWLLLLLFIIIFIEFHIISTLPFISKSIYTLNLGSADRVFMFSGLVSQLISNVPAAVFVSKFNQDWLAITCGVNVGGNGLVISSLANIIALRMAKNDKIWLTFHKYSLPYFLLTGTIAYLLFSL